MSTKNHAYSYTIHALQSAFLILLAEVILERALSKFANFENFMLHFKNAFCKDGNL
jgi:hypothetical protein